MKTFRSYNTGNKMILLTAFFLFVSAVAFSGEGGWATVDTRILLMLHPQMNGFDYGNGRFFRATGEKNIETTINELKTAREKATRESTPLRETQTKLIQERFILTQEFTRASGNLAPGDIESFRKEKAMLEASLEEVKRQRPANREAERIIEARRVDLQERLQIINNRLAGGGAAKTPAASESEIREKIEKIDLQLKETAVQLAIIEEKALSAIYLTTEETEKRLASITHEINSLIRKAAEDSKISTVIDNTFAMRSPQRKERLKMIPATDEAPDVVSSALFHSFNNLTINPEVAANITGPDNTPLPPEHLIVGRSFGMQSNLTQYLEFRNYLPEKVADFSHGRLFISGGTDLTPWVARQLFEKYKIPESVKNSFMLALRNYLDFDKQPTVRERDY